jgi:histidinol-phosphate aminotransferase
MQLSRRAFLETLGLTSTILAAAQLSPAISIALQNDGSSPQSTTIRLDRNENPYGPSPQVQAAIRNVLDTVNRYPSDLNLVTAIAEHHRVPPEQVLPGSGSSELLRAAASALLAPGRNIVVPLPTFEAITEYSRSAGAEVIAVPLNRRFAHDLEGMLLRTKASTGIVYICNPNNPTGSITPRADLDAFIAKLPPTTYVLVDEAYHQYAGESSTYASFLDRPLKDDRVIVTRSFSAVYGLAGLRLGYAVASPRVVERMRPYLTMQGVNTIVAQCAVTALNDTEGVETAIKKNADDRQEFLNQATARMLKPIDSHANFVMMDTHYPANDIIRYFREHNVAIGPVYPSMSTYIRVSLGTKEDMKAFWRLWDSMPFRRDVM